MLVVKRLKYFENVSKFLYLESFSSLLHSCLANSFRVHQFHRKVDCKQRIGKVGKAVQGQTAPPCWSLSRFPTFHSMKPTRSIANPPGGLLVQCQVNSLPVPIYTPGWREALRITCNCLAQEHNTVTQASARTQTRPLYLPRKI